MVGPPIFDLMLQHARPQRREGVAKGLWIRASVNRETIDKNGTGRAINDAGEADISKGRGSARLRVETYYRDSRIVVRFGDLHAESKRRHRLETLAPGGGRESDAQ
jgi:hypothetical protein